MSAPIGGQAVLEGVMMRGPSNWAVAVRKPDGQIAEGMRFLYERAKLACEPAGAAAAGAVLAGRVKPGRGVAVIVSGGNVEPHQAAAILREQ